MVGLSRLVSCGVYVRFGELQHTQRVVFNVSPPGGHEAMMKKMWLKMVLDSVEPGDVVCAVARRGPKRIFDISDQLLWRFGCQVKQTTDDVEHFNLIKRTDVTRQEFCAVEVGGLENRYRSTQWEVSSHHSYGGDLVVDVKTFFHGGGAYRLELMCRTDDDDPLSLLGDVDVDDINSLEGPSYWSSSTCDCSTTFGTDDDIGGVRHIGCGIESE